MKIKLKIWGVVITSMGWFPSISMAEVSDKIPSVQSALISGLLVGGGLFFIARFRWWLGVLLLPIPLIIIAESISLWNERVMQKAILIEQGWFYFVVLGIQDSLLLAGSILGIIFGYMKSKGRKAHSVGRQ